MMKVLVENFQSIEKLSLDLEGFTAITGDSNIGKSALVRAIRSALTNATGTYFVRHTPQCGKTETRKCKCFSRVHLQTDGFDLLWEKGDMKSRYVLNGTTYDKPGKGQPDFLSEVGLSLTKVGSESSLIQSAPQFKPIFLIDQSGPAIAESISDVSKLQRVNQATKLADRERRDTLTELKATESTITDSKLRLLSFAGLDSLVSQAQDVSTLESKVTEVSGRLDELSLLLARASAVTATKRGLEDVIPKLTEEDPTREAHDSWLALSGCIERAQRAKSVLAHLAPINSVEVPEVEEVVGLVHKVNQASRALKRVSSIQQAILRTSQDVPLPERSMEDVSGAFRLYLSARSYGAKMVKLATAEEEILREIQMVGALEREVAEELQALPKLCLECGRPFHEEGVH